MAFAVICELIQIRRLPPKGLGEVIALGLVFDWENGLVLALVLIVVFVVVHCLNAPSLE